MIIFFELRIELTSSFSTASIKDESIESEREEEEGDEGEGEEGAEVIIEDEKNLACPKSAICKIPSFEIRRLDGFKSRCMI